MQHDVVRPRTRSGRFPFLLVGAASALVLGLVAARSSNAFIVMPEDASGMRVGAVELRSAGVMTFGSDNTLFLADPMAATIYAIDVADPDRDTTTSGVRIDDVDGKIAAALGTTRDQLRIVDMVAHPVSQALYFSLTRGRGADATPVLVRVTKVDEKVTVLPLERIRHARTELSNAPAPDQKTPWGSPRRAMSITDLAIVEGELYVAGLSNEEFASTLRRVRYPFAANASLASTTVEIFHTSHNRYETASPIESFLPITLDGTPSLLAGYGCSPIATFARADLTSQKHVRGKTVSELGGGNRPLDMVTYRHADGKQYVLIANSDRTMTRFDVDDLAKAPGLTTAVQRAYQPAGVNYLPISGFGIVQLDNYNANHVVVLQRRADDGTLQVESRQLRWV
jgi:hypothetical protein